MGTLMPNVGVVYLFFSSFCSLTLRERCQKVFIFPRKKNICKKTRKRDEKKPQDHTIIVYNEGATSLGKEKKIDDFLEHFLKVLK